MIKPNTILLISSTLYSLVGLSSCSRNEPAPLETFGAAKMAVHDAERGDHTARFASSELQSAQMKLNEADQALSKHDNIRARRMSEQAIVDAQLANAKTLTAQTNLGVHEEIDALHDVQRGIQ
jgi:hypothetical protein